MLNIRQAVVAIICSLALNSSVFAFQFENEETESSKDQLLILHSDRSAHALQKVVAEVASKKVTITSDPETNVLILKGSEGDVKATAKLLTALQTRQETVNISVTIAVSDTNTGKGKIVDELKLTTLNGSEAELQFGQDVALRTGTQTSMSSLAGGRGGGGRTSAYSTKSVGTIVKVTPRVVSGGVMLSLRVEKSWVDQPPASEDESVSALPPSVYSAQTSTTLLIGTDQKQTIQALVSGGQANGRLALITVSATTGSQVKERVRSRNGAKSEQPRLIESRKNPATGKPSTGKKSEQTSEESPSEAVRRNGPSRGRIGGGGGGGRSRGGSRSGAERGRSATPPPS